MRHQAEKGLVVQMQVNDTYRTRCVVFFFPDMLSEGCSTEFVPSETVDFVYCPKGFQQGQ